MDTDLDAAWNVDACFDGTDHVADRLGLGHQEGANPFLEGPFLWAAAVYIFKKIYSYEAYVHGAVIITNAASIQD